MTDPTFEKIVLMLVVMLGIIAPAATDEVLTAPVLCGKPY
jgi:hypothetical protein